MFNLSTNKQPYRFEGYKALAFELAETIAAGLDRSERILLFVTGNLMKYFDVIEIERKASMVTRELHFLD